LKAQGFSQGEFPLRAADGTIVDVEWSARLGFLPGLHFCVVRDVTELRRSRESLRLQERVLASLREGVSVWDDEGRILYANKAEEAMFGYAPGELLGQPVDLLRRQPRPADLIASLARQAGWEGELANHTRHGAPFTTHARLGPIETGGRRGWVCVEEDITERKRAESRFRAVTEAKAAFAEGGLDFEAASRAVVEQLATLVGDCCTIRVLSKDGERLEPVAAHHDDPEACAWMKSLIAPEPLAADLFVTRAFKSNRTLLMTGLSAARLRERAGPRWRDYLDRFAPHSIMVAPMRVPGRVIGVLTLSRGGAGTAYGEEDVRIAEVLASRAAVTLESARLATMSHELRTPLNAIVGWAHLLRADDLDEATRLKAVETINRNAEIQTRMIGDVLDVSRIVTGKLRLNTMAVDLVAVMEDSLDSIRPAAAAKGVEIRQTLDPAVGQIKGDPERLQQVLWNLLSNAIRFTPSGGTITVSLHLSGGSVEMVVADDGPGIDPNFLPYAFDRFRQADSSSTRRHGGLGLGLALVRHLVELHGGTVDARNREEGSGAVFTIRLPRQVPAVQVAMSLLRRPVGMLEPVTPPKGRANINGVRVLAVDDDAGTREVIGALLERWGAEIQVAASAQDAFDKLLTGRPQVLLVDIEMPDEDGYSFLRRVRQLSAEQGGRVPAAALTAYASAEDHARALLAGFEAHVPKPVEPDELAAVIAHLAKAGREVGRGR
jgi:PAS domain S-box-containing protein